MCQRPVELAPFLFVRLCEYLGEMVPEKVAGEYFEVLTEEMEKLRIEAIPEIPYDELFIRSIDAFLPYRNQVISIFVALARSRTSDRAVTTVLRFFEGVVPYLDRPRDVTSWTDTDFDNFRFIAHEMFLYAMACFIRYQRFGAASELMSTEYYLGDSF